MTLEDDHGDEDNRTVVTVLTSGSDQQGDVKKNKPSRFQIWKKHQRNHSRQFKAKRAGIQPTIRHRHQKTNAGKPRTKLQRFWKAARKLLCCRRRGGQLKDIEELLQEMQNTIAEFEHDLNVCKKAMAAELETKYTDLSSKLVGASGAALLDESPVSNKKPDKSHSVPSTSPPPIIYHEAQEFSACRIQALFRGSTCRWKLAQRSSQPDLAMFVLQHAMGRHGTQTTQGSSLTALRARRRCFKHMLKHYDKSFVVKHGKQPTKADKEPIRHLYQQYHELKTQDLETLKSQKRALHKELRQFEQQFQNEHQRPVSSFDDIRPVKVQFRKYKNLKKEIEGLQKRK